MKALSLTPPWTEAILHHGKRVENRTLWKGCNYRGPILLHAAKGIGTRADFDDTCEALLRMGLLPTDLGKFASDVGTDRRFWVPRPELQRGGIVGRAQITGVIKDAKDMAAYTASFPGGEAQRKWWFGGFALILAGVEPLPFVPWKGALGLFNADYPFAEMGVQP